MLFQVCYRSLMITVYTKMSQPPSVPGLSDDPQQRIKRGKLSVPGEDVATIFRPVIQEIIRLVEGQISSTQRPIKAVLLVGGFGQSSYLRDSLRFALSPEIDIMQPAHG